ncbi:transporter [Thalassobaculum fulvum]|uniref:Transporter n=1 Tax=Thalassobaculum fulvum TaxID=1633335 RepID=A0A919CMC7_9PROT|nr:BON domain-containing protein [Thalassobaculum fulvum]GHD39769.1 transporter [Thalassobaculum fulvum]
MPRSTPSAPLLAVLVAIAVGSAGCTPLGVAVGAGAAGATATQTEKGFAAAVDDTRIKAELNGLFFRTDADLYQSVTFKVEEGRVLLTGVVPKPDDRVQASKLAWSVDEVREVLNELKVSDETSLTDKGRDVTIAAKLRARLLVDDKVSLINYSIDVVNQTVYIMGVARTEAELQRVLGTARDIAYVRQVVDFVRVAKPG